MRKISPSLEKEILAKAAEGESPRSIAQWLGAERRLKISHQAISKLLKKTRKDRAEVAKAVVREALTKTVTSDLDRLAAAQDRATRLATRLHDRVHALLDEIDHSDDERSIEDRINVTRALAPIAEAALKALDREDKLTNTRLHFSGADASEESTNEPTPGEARRLLKERFREVEPAGSSSDDE